MQAKESHLRTTQHQVPDKPTTMGLRMLSCICVHVRSDYGKRTACVTLASIHLTTLLLLPTHFHFVW
jgi:hypothetical protein